MLLTGKEIKEKKIIELKNMIKKIDKTLELSIILIGDNSASKVYVKNKIKFASELGIKVNLVEFGNDVKQSEVEKTVININNDYKVDALFIQLPIPDQLNEDKLIKLIDYRKDVDGFCVENIGELFLERADYLGPCTVEGIMEMLDFYNIDVIGKDVVIVGRSNIVGKPLAVKLINKGATVTVCNSKTKDIKKYSYDCDIFISAIGSSKFFDDTYFNGNQFIIDVGINRDEENKLCGDIDFDKVKDKVKGITPVPGGVGVLTVVKVIENIIKAYNIKGDNK